MRLLYVEVPVKPQSTAQMLVVVFIKPGRLLWGKGGSLEGAKAIWARHQLLCVSQLLFTLASGQVLHLVPLAVMDKEKCCGPGGKTGQATGEDTGFPHRHVSIGRRERQKQDSGCLGIVLNCLSSRSGIEKLCVFNWLKITDTSVHCLELMFSQLCFSLTPIPILSTVPYWNLIPLWWTLLHLWPTTHCFLHFFVLSGLFTT